MENVLSTGPSSNPPILSIVGRSNSGKTTLIEKLIPLLREAGYRVATIKHDVHDIDIDKEGKDSWRHREAGADAVVLVSQRLLFFTQPLAAPPRLAEVRDRFFSNGVDLVLAEGFKQEGFPKIEVSRAARASRLIASPDDSTLLAVVTDNEALETPSPRFHLDDIEGVRALIVRTFLGSEKGRD